MSDELDSNMTGLRPGPLVRPVKPGGDETMSRIGKQPIAIPARGEGRDRQGRGARSRGRRASSRKPIHPNMKVESDGKQSR